MQYSAAIVVWCAILRATTFAKKNNNIIHCACNNNKTDTKNKKQQRMGSSQILHSMGVKFFFYSLDVI